MTPARAAFEADLKVKIAGTVLEPHLQKLLEKVKTHINIHLKPTDVNDLPLRVSRMAGLPDLPPKFEWPEFKGQPLEFIAQFNLEQVAPFDIFEQLPKTGMLSFFHHKLGTVPEDPSGWRVCLHPLEGLERRELPYILNGERFSCSASFETTYALFPHHDFFELDDDSWDAVFELAKSYIEPAKTHLLGTSYDCSNVFEIEGVLLEISEDESHLVQWDGVMIFGLDDEDLKAHRVEKVWTDLSLND